MPNIIPSRLNSVHFVRHARVEQLIGALAARFDDPDYKDETGRMSTGNFRKLIVSDVLDTKPMTPSTHYERQYVELVQEGGGMLGIALAGYTHVLESVGIRFLGMAGTSAGAINTALMTAIDERQDVKTPKVIQALCAQKPISFVDGSRVYRLLIGLAVKPLSKVKLVALAVLMLFAFMTVPTALIGLSYVQLGNVGTIRSLTQFSFFAIGVYAFIVAFTGLLTYRAVRRFSNRGYGINRGTKFREWVDGIMTAHDVQDVQSLKQRKLTLPDGYFRLRPSNPNKTTEGLCPKMVIVTAEIGTRNKIEFPEIEGLFAADPFPDGTPKNMATADFVRASMSIPFFFDTHVVNVVTPEAPSVSQRWQSYFQDVPPERGRFVDGGLLSNFPMSVFYNHKVKVPRLPTFGVRLDDSKPVASVSEGLMSYAGRIFSTVRHFYDKDFLLKNRLFQKGIGVINVPDFNCLNFDMTDEEQLGLFVRGAEAAYTFLTGDLSPALTAAEISIDKANRHRTVAEYDRLGLRFSYAHPTVVEKGIRPALPEPGGFNWESYKAARVKLHEDLNKIPL